MIQHVCLAQCTLFLFSHAKCFCGPYSIRATEGGIGKYETPRGDGNVIACGVRLMISMIGKYETPRGDGNSFLPRATVSIFINWET